MTENLLFISCQPFDFKFTWQIDVQCWNFREMGVSDKYHVLIWYKGSEDLSEWKRLEDKYKEVKFFYYRDEGARLDVYIPVLRPHCLKRHFKKFEEEFKGKIFFYLDSDVIFRELPDMNLLGGDIIYQSDTSSYLDYDYLYRKEKQGNIPEEEVIKGLAKIGRITPDIIKSYKGNTGGAQYILKNIDHTFWEDVEKMSLQIIEYLSFNRRGINKKYFKTESEGFQSWCADMWAVNFSLWKRGLKTSTHKEMAFTWATDPYNRWFENKIYHDAGAGIRGLFKKGEWVNKSPVGRNISVLKSFASHHYVEAIKKVK